MTDWLTVQRSYLGKRRTYDNFTRAQHGNCYLCGERLPLTWLLEEMDSPTRDHVYPRAGRPDMLFDHSNNILLAHRRCNLDKGSREPHPCEVLYLHATHMRLSNPFGNKKRWRELSDEVKTKIKEEACKGGCPLSQPFGTSRSDETAQQDTDNAVVKGTGCKA